MKTVTTVDLLVAMLFTFSIGAYVGVHWASFDWGRRWVSEEVDQLIKRDKVLVLLESQSFDQARQLQTEYLRQAVKQAVDVPDLPDRLKVIVERRKPLLTP